MPGHVPKINKNLNRDFHDLQITRTSHENSMIHKLCKTCINTCKQDTHAIIVRCPKYRKRLSADEFRSLVDELDAMEKEADTLRGRVRSLIEKVADRENVVHEDNDDEEYR